MHSPFPTILDQAHDWVRRVLRPGDVAVDATVGNGRDTLFLAEAVGETGRVIGFDIQPIALEETERRLREAGVSGRVELLLRGHEELSQTLAMMYPAPRPRVVMFNLGYRPGGDHRQITRPESTLAALDAACDVLVPGGLITIVAYPGHEGGQVEAEAVLDWASALPSPRACVVSYHSRNARSPAPFLVAVQWLYTVAMATTP